MSQASNTNTVVSRNCLHHGDFIDLTDDVENEPSKPSRDLPNRQSATSNSDIKLNTSTPVLHIINKTNKQDGVIKNNPVTIPSSNLVNGAQLAKQQTNNNSFQTLACKSVGQQSIIMSQQLWDLLKKNIKHKRSLPNNAIVQGNKLILNYSAINPSSTLPTQSKTVTEDDEVIFVNRYPKSPKIGATSVHTTTDSSSVKRSTELNLHQIKELASISNGKKLNQTCKTIGNKVLTEPEGLAIINGLNALTDGHKLKTVGGNKEELKVKKIAISNTKSLVSKTIANCKIISINPKSSNQQPIAISKHFKNGQSEKPTNPITSTQVSQKITQDDTLMQINSEMPKCTENEITLIDEPNLVIVPQDNLSADPIVPPSPLLTNFEVIPLHQQIPHKLTPVDITKILCPKKRCGNEWSPQEDNTDRCKSYKPVRKVPKSDPLEKGFTKWERTKNPVCLKEIQVIINSELKAIEQIKRNMVISRFESVFLTSMEPRIADEMKFEVEECELHLDEGDNAVSDVDEKKEPMTVKRGKEENTPLEVDFHEMDDVMSEVNEQIDKLGAKKSSRKERDVSAEPKAALALIKQGLELIKKWSNSAQDRVNIKEAVVQRKKRGRSRNSVKELRQVEVSSSTEDFIPESEEIVTKKRGRPKKKVTNELEKYCEVNLCMDSEVKGREQKQTKHKGRKRKLENHDGMEDGELFLIKKVDILNKNHKVISTKYSKTY